MTLSGTKPLGDLCEFVRGVSFDSVVVSYEPIDSYYPILRAGNIANQLFLDRDLIWVPASLVSEEQTLKEGDIVICLSSGSPDVVGKCAALEKQWRGSVGAFCGIIRSKEPKLASFLKHWFRSPAYFRWRNAQARGANIQNLRFSELAKLECTLPGESRLAFIANRLDVQLAAIDRARAAAEERLNAAKGLAAAYLRSTFDELTSLGYPKEALGDIVELLPSKSISQNGDAVVSVITTACLTEFGFEPAGIKEARMKGSDVALSKVKKGEILVARSNTPDLVGRVSMFPGMNGDVCASDLTIRILPVDAASSGYIAYYLIFLYLSGYWKERAGGASGSMKKITRTHIQNLELPIPPIVEQERISNHLNNIITGARQLRSAVESHFESINDLPGALLREAFERVDT